MICRAADLFDDLVEPFDNFWDLVCVVGTIFRALQEDLAQSDALPRAHSWVYSRLKSGIGWPHESVSIRRGWAGAIIGDLSGYGLHLVCEFFDCF